MKNGENIMRLGFLLPFLTVSLLAQVAEKPKAIAMVKEAVAMFKKSGKEATFKEVNQGRFHTTRENALYVFVYAEDGTCVAHGFKANFIGINRLGVKDPDGKFYMKDSLELAKAKGKGWNDYKFFNPATQKVENKTSYLEYANGFVFGCGVYK